MLRIEKQNIYITKLNSKLTEQESLNRKPSKARNFSSNDAEKKKIHRSVDELPDLNKGKVKPDFLEHIPSPHVPARILKRY